jgi:hypothetical protein
LDCSDCTAKIENNLISDYSQIILGLILWCSATHVSYQSETKSHSTFGNIHLLLNQTHYNIDFAAQQQWQTMKVSNLFADYYVLQKWECCNTLLLDLPAQT